MTRKPKRAKAEPNPKFNGRRPTINDVARLARVSKKTVSRVINKSPFVKEKTRERVDAMIKEIGYTPDPMARGLASKRSFLVGLIYDQPNPQYVIDMQQGILDVIRGSGFELVVHPVPPPGAGLPAECARNFVERQKLAGVVLPPSVSEDDELVDAAAGIRLSLCAHRLRAAGRAGAFDRHARRRRRRAGGGASGRARTHAHRPRLGPGHVPLGARTAGGVREGPEGAQAEAGARATTCKAAYTFQSGVEAGRKLMELDEPPDCDLLRQ